MKKILFIDNLILPNDTNISQYKYNYYFELLNIYYVCNDNDSKTMERVIISNRKTIHNFNRDLLKIYQESKTFEDIQIKTFLMSKQYNCDYPYNDNNNFILENLMGDCHNSPKNYNEAMSFLKKAGKQLYEKYQLNLDTNN